MEISDIIQQIYPLPHSSLAKLAACMQRVERPKGYQVVERGKVKTDIYFIAQGIAQAFVYHDGRRITFWIGAEGTVILALKSYVNNEPSYESIELLEDAVLYVLRRADLEQFLNDDIHIANWARRFAESEFLRTEQRLIPMLFTTAAKRYEELLRRQPELLQRVPLEHLASYLGITPVSLSRIRAKIK